MNTKLQTVLLRLTLLIIMSTGVFMLGGCQQAPAPADSAGQQTKVDQPAEVEHPLGHVAEFGNFTLRANISRANDLPDTMARRYGIEPADDLFLLNLVVLQNQPGQQPTTVSAEISVQHETLVGHVQTIDMRAIEADSHVSYIGTLDGSAERIFKIVIKAHPAGAEQALNMDFEVRLEAFELGGVP